MPCFKNVTPCFNTNAEAAAPAAATIEYGWPQKNIQAQPYLSKTVNANMGYIVEKYNNYIQDEIKKYNLD